MNYMKILSSWNTTMINTIKTIKLFYVLLLSLSVILFSGCSGCDTDGGSGEDEPLSSEKAITSFVFEAANNTWSGTDYACTISGTDISVTLPYGTSLADLVPTIVITGVTVDPASGVPHTFTDGAAETYTVTAADASTQTYDVTVNVASSGGLILEGNYYISDADDIAYLAGYSEITGNLIISTTTLTNLDGGGLGSLTAVRGYLRISYTSLENINGLSNLEFIGGLIINSNDDLLNIDGLEGIVSIGGYVQISSNPLLANLNGLANLETIGMNMLIVRNDSLVNLSGLESITDITEYL